MEEVGELRERHHGGVCGIFSDEIIDMLCYFPGAEIVFEIDDFEIS